MVVLSAPCLTLEVTAPTTSTANTWPSRDPARPYDLRLLDDEGQATG